MSRRSPRAGRADHDRLVVGVHPVRELLRAGAPIHEVRIAAGRRDDDTIAEIRDRAAAAGVPVRSVDRDEVRDADGAADQGVAAIAPPFRYHDLGAVLDAVPASEAALLVALDGVTDPHNLGSIARTAEAFGAHGLVVPKRRAAPVTPTAEKAAAGALAHLPVAHVTNLVRTLRELGARGVWSVGLDADADAAVGDQELLTEPLVLVVGAEGRGLGRLAREACDALVAIPTRGRVASLNASVAAAITLYAVEERRRRPGPSRQGAG